jgi:hypothetical protein
MDSELSLIGSGGDTRISFTKNQVRVTWTKRTARERKALNKLIDTAKEQNFSIVTVDADGNADMPASRKDLPGLFGKASGEVLLQSTEKNVRKLATVLVEGEHGPRMVLSVSQDDGTWKKLQPGEFAAAKEEEAKELELAVAKGEKTEPKSEKVHASEVPSGG